MNQTENLHLPQWEAEDRIMRTDFNEAMASIDGAIPKIAAGTYTGDGTAARTISLGFTPKAVLVTNSQSTISSSASGNHYWYGGFAVTDHPVVVGQTFTFLEISNGGFVVHEDDSNPYFHYHGNCNGSEYYYIAVG